MSTPYAPASGGQLPCIPVYYAMRGGQCPPYITVTLVAAMPREEYGHTQD